LTQRASFFVADTPIPKARPRVVRDGKFPRTYTPKTTVQWERLIAIEFKRQCRGIFFEKSVALKFYAEIVMPGSGSLSTIRGDIDNHSKCLFDALNSLAFFDDFQITDLHVLKRRARKGEQTGDLITIEPASEVQSNLFAVPMEKQRDLTRLDTLRNLCLPLGRKRTRRESDRELHLLNGVLVAGASLLRGHNRLASW
jgi:Holliday junction resolvase RusA-like endonuclease